VLIWVSRSRLSPVQMNVALMFAAPDMEHLPGHSGMSFLTVRLPLTYDMSLSVTWFVNDFADASPRPRTQILILRTGKPCGLLLWAIVCSVAFFVVHVTLHSCSRSVFAFAKDGALPFSPFLARLSPATRTPLMAVWFSVGCCLLLGALNFISSEAGNAIVAMCPVALDVSYAIAVLCRRIWANVRRSGLLRLMTTDPKLTLTPSRLSAPGRPIPPVSIGLSSTVEHIRLADALLCLGRRPNLSGPFALPEPWSLLCNLMALCWIAFVCVILCWPTVHDFTAKTFNWSGVRLPDGCASISVLT